MPAYFTKEEIYNMIHESEELIFSIDNAVKNTRYYLSNIDIYVNIQSEKSIHSIEYYDKQLFILSFTNILEKIIYPYSSFKYNSIITNKHVFYEEEYYLLKEKIQDIQVKKKHEQNLQKSKKIYNKLVLGSMKQILPEELLLNVAYHLATKRPSRKRVSTNWQNFCKQRKLSKLPYNENSNIWKLLDNDTKNKYKNPHYKHF